MHRHRHRLRRRALHASPDAYRPEGLASWRVVAIYLVAGAALVATMAVVFAIFSMLDALALST